MEKEFVKYMEALALKELGFDESCLACYIDEEDKDILSFSFDSNDCYQEIGDNELKRNTHFKNSITAPTYSAAFRWFEDNHQLYPAVVTDQTSYPKYAFEIASFFGNPKDLTEKEWGWNEMVLSRSLYRTKTEAELECLKKLIEIVKEK